MEPQVIEIQILGIESTTASSQIPKLYKRQQSFTQRFVFKQPKQTESLNQPILVAFRELRDLYERKTPT